MVLGKNLSSEELEVINAYRKSEFGSVSIVAITKARGYGRQLMVEMKKYIHRFGLTAVGFCAPETSGFYAKCGYRILADGVKRFRFIGEAGQVLLPDHADGDVLYLDDGGVMALALRHPDEPVIAQRAAW